MRIGILCCAALAATGAAQERDTPLFRTQTRIVEVTLQATRSNGLAVVDLTPAELQLFDNGKEQTIRSLERVAALPPGASGVARPPAGANRLSILLLDALNTDWSDQYYARRAAARVLEQIPPGHRIAIFALGNGLHLLHDFSSDAASLKALAQRFSGIMPRDELASTRNPLAAEFSYAEVMRINEPRSGSFAELLQRRRILDTLRALTTLARLVKRAPGQKNLLWLSSGFPLRLKNESLHDEAAETARELNAANLTIYPIDARGLSISPAAFINIATMQELAEKTGGKAFYNSNDLASMVRSAFEDSGTGYVLTYAPSDLRDDGKYHSLRVRTSRRRVRLRCRPGYFADAPGTASQRR